MRKMVVLSVLFWICFLGEEINGQSKNEIDSITKLVHNLIVLKKQGIDVSYFSKQNVRLGDSSATSLLKNFTIEEMLLKENISACLSILKNSFINLKAIDKPNDRIPIKTMSLLEDLRKNSKDPSLISMIDETIKSIGVSTKASKF